MSPSSGTERPLDLAHLLERTSRTFALSIPVLPEPTRREVGIAYLLFRIADTFEDATLWTRTRKRAALETFIDLLERPDAGAAEPLARGWASDPPLDHEGYVELLEETPAVLAAYTELREGARTSIRRHVVRTSEGMADFVDRADDGGRLVLTGLQDLRDYCYVVAGIVGEMLTELFLLGRPKLESVAGTLREKAHLFGEGLQLTNILKDSAADAEEGRLFISDAVDRGEAMALARSDLDHAVAYTLALQEAGAEPGIVSFNALPVALAQATLDVVERKGPGSKISRPQLWSIVRRVEKAVEAGRPPVAPLALDASG